MVPSTAVLRDLEILLGAQLDSLGFSGAPRPGVRCYSATFERPGSPRLAVIVTVTDEQTTLTSHPREIATA